jgi:hypothetical protein
MLNPAMPTPRRILFIGNSYTFCNDLPRQLTMLAAAAGVERPIEAAFTGSGGWTLEQHWNHAPCRELLGRGGWDEVVLQEQTRRPYEGTALYHDYARRFHGEIQRLRAKTVLYLTWAPGLEPERQPQLDQSVGAIGKELGVTVVAAGPAFALVRSRAPQLPLYVPEDQRHPSSQGTYLAACAFFATLHRRSPVGLAADSLVGERPNAKPRKLDSQETRTLQTAAWDAVTSWHH